jgi:hypothetical protein
METYYKKDSHINKNQWFNLFLDRKIKTTKCYHLVVLCGDEIHRQIVINHFTSSLVLNGSLSEDDIKKYSLPLYADWRREDEYCILFHFGGKVSFIIPSELDKLDDFTSLDTFISLGTNEMNIVKSKLRGNYRQVGQLGYTMPYTITLIN